MKLQAIEHRTSGRAKLMLRHTLLVAVGGTLALIGVVAAAFYIESQPTVLRVAVGPPNSEDVRMVQAIAQQFARDRATIRLRPVIRDGPLQSAKAIDSGEADIAVVRQDVDMPQAGQVVAILRKNLVVFIVPAQPPAATASKAKGGKKTPDKNGKKKIEKIEQLAGRRLAVIGRTEANINLLKVILRQYDLAPEKVDVVQIETTDVGTKIRDAKVDAIMSVGPVGSRITADAIAAAMRKKEAPTFLPIEASEAIAERVPVYQSVEIAAGAFGGAPQKPPEAVETIGFSHFIVARKALSEATAGEFTRLLLGARQSLTAEFPAVGKIEAPDTEKGAAVAVHPGAAAYLDGEQKSFFERYNDWIYYGLMLLSFVGSAAAWLMNYTRVDDRAKKLGLLDRLLEVMKEAREAPNVDRLDQLQVETDQILETTIHQVEDQNLDQTALQAFVLALDQTRRAIAERRDGLHAASSES